MSQLPDIKKGEKTPKPFSTEKLPGRTGCGSRLYLVHGVFSGSAGSSCFQKLLKSKFSSLSHMNKTVHVKWLKSSRKKKEDALTGECKVSELLCFLPIHLFGFFQRCILFGLYKLFIAIALKPPMLAWQAAGWSVDGKVALAARGQRQRWPPVTAIINVPDRGSQRECVSLQGQERWGLGETRTLT